MQKNEIDNLIQKQHHLEMELAASNEEKQSLSTKLDLISTILTAVPLNNPEYQSFKQLLNQFTEFQNRESSLAAEAKAVLQLQSLKNKIKTIVNYKEVFNKNILGIGGGFSAGKSEFISSFIEGDTIKLPIGLQPTTAIPTFITNGFTNEIKGYSKQGGCFDIPTELYQKLSHDFIRSFSFNLKDIMPVMTLSTPLAYNNICFIDTPGYNPSDTSEGFTKEDINTAKEHLEQANTLLWLIGLDSNGTIPTSDLKFLNNLSLNNKKFFLIANKADLKSDEDIEDILDDFEDILNDEEIEYAGICAFNSIGKEEKTYRKQSLFDFLTLQNKEIEIDSDIINDFTKIFDKYEEAINKDLEFIKQIKKELHSLEIDIVLTTLESDDDDNAIIKERLLKLKNFFKQDILEKNLQDLKNLKSKILENLNKIFKSVADDLN